MNEVDGWYLVRPSETSPFFRVYSQYDDPEKAKSKVEEYSALIEKLKG
jgi:phosphomannomutase